MSIPPPESTLDPHDVIVEEVYIPLSPLPNELAVVTPEFFVPVETGGDEGVWIS
jgi:hypothetical protein